MCVVIRNPYLWNNKSSTFYVKIVSETINMCTSPLYELVYLKVIQKYSSNQLKLKK